MDTILGIISELAREPYYSIPALSLVTVGIGYLSRKSFDRQREQKRQDLIAVMDSIPLEHRVSVGRVVEVLVRQYPYNQEIQEVHRYMPR